ncbi:hypothetical protein [Nitrococcus mobilis]|uniref:hypothetical protein n=1 Tax=Nitrococcus mobilis TaxID=35797 RepID=UPI000310ED28|nr:hypothetical protein [Nitrococcus mobilis]
MTEASTQTLPTLTGKWFEIGPQFLESTARNIQHLGAGPNSLQEACGEQLEATRSDEDSNPSRRGRTTQKRGA